MEIIVSAVAVIVAAGCFMAIVASDLRENDRLFTLRDTTWSNAPANIKNEKADKNA